MPETIFINIKGECEHLVRQKNKKKINQDHYNKERDTRNESHALFLLEAGAPLALDRDDGCATHRNGRIQTRR